MSQRPTSVALALFPISQEGGLATRVMHTHDLLERNGIKADFFRIAYSDKDHRKGYRNPRIKADHHAGLKVEQYKLSITDKLISETLQILSNYDCVMFVHACPHISDTQKATENWRMLYTDVEARKLTYFTDVYMDKYYPHITDVKGYFEPLAINEAAMGHIHDTFPMARLARAPFAYHKPDILKPLERRSRDVMWPTAWRGWKGIERFLKAVPDIAGSVDLFGSGRDYYALLKDKERVAKIYGSRDALMYGTVEPQKITKAYGEHKISCDFTGQSPKYHGHVNRTTIEPMFFGCVSAVMPTMPVPYSLLPRDVVLSVDPDDVAGSINAGLVDTYRLEKIAANAREWLAEEFSDEKLLSQIFGN